jgi:hypothetical protein
LKFLFLSLLIVFITPYAYSWSERDRFSCRGANWEYVEGAGMREKGQFLSSSNDMLIKKFKRYLGYGTAKVTSGLFQIDYEKGGTFTISSDQDGGKAEHLGSLMMPGHKAISLKCRWTYDFYDDVAEIDHLIKLPNSEKGFWSTFTAVGGFMTCYEDCEYAKSQELSLQVAVDIANIDAGVLCRSVGKLQEVHVVKSYTHCESVTESIRKPYELPYYDCHAKLLVKCSSQITDNGTPKGNPIGVTYH